MNQWMQISYRTSFRWTIPTGKFKQHWLLLSRLLHRKRDVLHAIQIIMLKRYRGKLSWHFLRAALTLKMQFKREQLIYVHKNESNHKLWNKNAWNRLSRANIVYNCEQKNVLHFLKEKTKKSLIFALAVAIIMHNVYNSNENFFQLIAVAFHLNSSHKHM